MIRADMALGRRRFLLGAALLPVLSCPVRAEEERLGFDQLYKSFGIRGLVYSDRLLALKDRRVVMKGYLAPPLKPESNFFVMTREPVSVCPFCQSDADWPDDIVVVYLREAAAMGSGGEAISVTGMLNVGPWTDPVTGFVSQIRIVDASQRRA